MGKLLFLPLEARLAEDRQLKDGQKNEDQPSSSVSREQAFAALMSTSQNVILREIRSLNMRDITFELVAKALNLKKVNNDYFYYDNAFTGLIQSGVLHENGKGNYYLDDVLAKVLEGWEPADRQLFAALQDGVFSQKFPADSVTYHDVRLVAWEAGLEDDLQVTRSLFTLIHSGVLRSVEGKNGVYRLTRF